MKQDVREDLGTIAAALNNSQPGIMARDLARRALERIKHALECGNVERIQREFLAKDLRALAKGKPVTTDLAKAVEARIAGLRPAEIELA